MPAYDFMGSFGQDFQINPMDNIALNPGTDFGFNLENMGLNDIGLGEDNPLDFSAGIGDNPTSGLLGQLGGLQGVLGGLGALAQAWQGMQELGLAEDMFDFNKSSTNRNLANQARLLNAQMQDRQNARIASTGASSGTGGYQQTSDYMNQNRVDGSAIG